MSKDTWEITIVDGKAYTYQVEADNRDRAIAEAMSGEYEPQRVEDHYEVIRTSLALEESST